MANSSTGDDPSLQEETHAISDENIQILFSELLPAATRWKKIGLALQCPLYRLKLIESKQGNRDASHFLLDMLDYRLKCATPSYLSWKEVCYALKERTVNEERLAHVIAQKHCPHILEELKRSYSKNPLAELSSISVSSTFTGCVVAVVAVLIVVIGWLLQGTLHYSSDGEQKDIPVPSEPGYRNQPVTPSGDSFSVILPLYRYWNPGASDHFYTLSEEEIGTTVHGQFGNHGYKYEGIQCHIYQHQVEHSVPLYRYWKHSSRDHFYTTHSAEIGTTTPGKTGNHGYKSEGITGYCFTEQMPNTIPLYRYWNPSNADHFYTTNMNEIGTATAGQKGRHGYVSEDVVCYVIAS